MKSDLAHSLTHRFEDHAYQTGDGVEFWLARDIQHLLGYTEWRNFTAVGACYPYYLLADSKDGQLKEAERSKTLPATQATYGNIAHGFVYQRVPHITLKSIANNPDIDRIWDEFQPQLERLRTQLNRALKTNWQEWEIPREADEKWSAKAQTLHADLVATAHRKTTKNRRLDCRPRRLRDPLRPTVRG